MTKLKVLDLYCGVGLASEGYADAGCEVTGVDLDPKCEKYYPYKFIWDSVLNLTVDFLREFDFIHSSPPCQAHSDLRNRTGIDYIDLIPDTRQLLIDSGVPYVIENVESTNDHLINPMMLCGTMFGNYAHCRDGEMRQLWRHRLFETSFPIKAPGKCRHIGQPIGVYGDGGGGQQNRGYKAYADEGREAMDMGFYAPRKYVNQGIPRAFTNYIIKEFMKL